MERRSDLLTDRHRRERGVSGLEYVGIVLMVGVIIAAITLVVTPTGVGGNIQKAWCLITGGGDSCAGEVPVDIDALLPDCEVTNTEYSGNVEGTVFSVNLGVNGKATLATVKNANDETKYTVTLSGGGKLGAHVMFGEKGKFGLGEGLSAEAKAAFEAEGGVTFEFDSQEEANQFIKDTAKEAAKWAAASQAGILAPIVKGGLDWATGDYNPPSPKEYYVQLGIKGSGEAAAAAGPEAKLGVESGNALGMKVEPGKNGESDKYTIYYKGSAKLTAALGLGGEGEVETQVAITYQDGKPIAASVNGAGNIKSSLLGGAEGGGIPLGPGGQGTPSLGVNAGGVVKGTVALELDLTNQANKDALADVLQSTGMPIMSGSGTPGYQDPVDAVSGLADRFTQGGPLEGATFTAQQFEGSTAGLDVGAWAGDLLAFGAGGGVSTTTLTATNAAYYDPAVGGMVSWRRCGG